MGALIDGISTILSGRDPHRQRRLPRGQLHRLPLRPAGERAAVAARSTSCQRPAQPGRRRRAERPGRGRRGRQRLRPRHRHQTAQLPDHLLGARTPRADLHLQPQREGQSPSTRRPTCRCSGCCATTSGSPARSTAAASACAAPAPATSTGRRPSPAPSPVSDVAGKNVVTIEGLANGGTLHPVQQAWLDEDVAQCGFCQPGQIMAAAALLKANTHPTDADIDAIENVCRCGTYCPHPRSDQTRRPPDCDQTIPAYSYRYPTTTPPSFAAINSGTALGDRSPPTKRRPRRAHT